MFNNFIQGQQAFIPIKLLTPDGRPVTGVAYTSITVTLLKPDGIAPSSNITIDNINNLWQGYTFGSFAGQGVYGLTLAGTNINEAGQFVIAITGGGGQATADITVVTLDSTILGGPGFTTGTDDLTSIRNKLNAISPAGGSGPAPLAVDENTGGTDNLRYVTSSATPIIGATIRVFNKTDWDAANYSAPVGVSYTNDVGRWGQPVYVTPGSSYVIQFQLSGQYGPDTATIVV